MDDYPRLTLGKIYVAETRNKNIYIGTYTEFIRDPQYGYIMYYVLDNVTDYHYSFWLKKIKPEKLKGTAFFSSTDTFYDLEEIKENGKKARQTMEKRSLDIILKQVVNENFEWA
jgi:hypothetical protein